MGHRERLLEGAKKCLLDKGFAGTTARDIVQASGTNLASIGYHFGSKDALLMAAMIEAVSDWGDALDVLPTIAAGRSRIERMTTELDAVATSMPRSRALWLATFEAGTIAEHQPELRKQLAEAQRFGRRGLAAGVLGVPEPEVTEEQARRIGGAYLTLLSGIAAQHLIDSEHAPSARELIETLHWLTSEAPDAPPPTTSEKPPKKPARKTTPKSAQPSASKSARRSGQASARRTPKKPARKTTPRGGRRTKG